MMDTPERARTLQRRFPRLGTYIAVLDILRDGSFRIERTLREPGHHTVWGDPERLLGVVIAVLPARMVDE